MKMPIVEFKGERFELVGTLDDGGGMSREGDFKAGRVSYAHLYSDGTISRFGVVIGSRDELTVVGEWGMSLPEMLNALLTMLHGFESGEWSRPQ